MRASWAAMLFIRENQMAALGRPHRDEFIDEVLALIARHWPNSLKRRGEADLRAMIDATIDEAARYGVTTRRDVMKLVNVKLALGDDFVERHAWARQILTDA